MTRANDSGAPLVGVVLAAGKGTRMRSELPKVLHPVAGRPLLGWVLEAARAAGCGETMVVVGHGAERVRQAFADRDLAWVEQERQLGTGDALARAAPHLAGAEAMVVVLSGDVPLVSPRTLERLVHAARDGWGAMAVAEVADPGALGRVVRSATGTLERIVEHADASAEERALTTVNAGLYALGAPRIFELLETLQPANAQGELYLTDALNRAAAEGLPLALVELDDPAEAMGVNSRADQAAVHRLLLERKARALEEAGVTIWAPERTTIEPTVEVGRDSVIHPEATLLGATRLGEGCEIHSGAWLSDCRLGDGVVVHPHSVLEGAEIGAGASVGPFARLRPGAVLGAGVKVGNFVEVKNSRLGDGVKASHLSYLGDAEIGAGSNIGAGTITCNYDGYRKHRTEIGRGASIGSDTMLIAPVKVGDEAETAAGSVISSDVPSGALAIERSRQRNVPGWSERKRRRNERRGEPRKEGS